MNDECRDLAKASRHGDECEPATQTGVQALDQARARDHACPVKDQAVLEAFFALDKAGLN